jgi:hypothetical protein
MFFLFLEPCNVENLSFLFSLFLDLIWVECVKVSIIIALDLLDQVLDLHLLYLILLVESVLVLSDLLINLFILILFLIFIPAKVAIFFFFT